MRIPSGIQRAAIDWGSHDCLHSPEFRLDFL